ncbi:hypothetical protein O0L34_g4541 [Tuta absoluta]|nr:hypothetical protein O0L34_g4541 [Tuta absoluta]
MIANLPLLFANGNPTALSKITASELEKFITFMVTCSWGHDTARNISKPPWWPSDVAFSHPFVRPSSVPRDWEARLKNLVRKCYDYHKSAFLLVFSAQLARYPRNRLRYVDNHDHTTSLYYRPNSRLLVTFRNENLFYDKGSTIDIEDDEPQIKSTDIYLCDNCDSHFDNYEVLKAHERLCNNENLPSSTISGGLPEFLSALKLKAVGDPAEEPKSNTDDTHKSRNSRHTTNIDRGPPYPFSSLAYIKNSKTNIQRDTSYIRERIERYCDTTIPLSKIVSNKTKNQQFPVRYRRPIDYWNRKHVFPDQRNKKILDLNAQLLLLKCRPISVDVERMSSESMQAYMEKIKEEAENRKLTEDKDVVFVDGDDCDQQSNVEKDSHKKQDAECEVIDLCSDDESSSVNENCDPRAGVTCVMRGGAVLRRTAATPRALPAEPCGARERPLPPAILHPHPVILIAHTLNNLQTISLE